MAKLARQARWTPPPAPEAAQAVGGHEAAAILGVHFTVPYRMAEKGRLTVHHHDASAGRRMTFFDGGECDYDYREYCEAMASAKGTGKRERTRVADRPAVLRHLAGVKNRIPLSDAISTPEAAAILGMYPSYAIVLAKKGVVVGRQLWSPRSHRGPVQWMFSRKSCQANLAKAKALYAAGRMTGRVRNGVKKRTVAK